MRKFGIDDALRFDVLFVEVYQKTKLVMGDGQIVAHLHPMNIGKGRNSFNFNDDFVETNEICNVIILKFNPTIT